MDDLLRPTPRPRAALRVGRRAWQLAGLALAAALLVGCSDAASAAAAAAKPEATLASLMHHMADTSGVIAPFHEVKELSLLSEPVETSGTLYFIPPDHLARITTRPGRSKLLIDGKRFSFEDDATGKSMDLSDNPVAREFASNFVVLFNGDLHALRSRYHTDFHADAEGWTLVLRPRKAPLTEFIARLTLSGHGRSLDRMVLLETNDDRTTTTFQDVRTDYRFSREELQRIFGMPGAAAAAP